MRQVHPPIAGIIQRDAEDLSGEKQQGVKGLILRRAGHIAGYGEMGQKRLDLGGSHLLWVAFVVEKDIPSHPVEVGVFSTNRVMFSSDDVPSPLEEFMLGLRSRRPFDTDVCRLHTASP